jgi:HEAT repeat protein
MDPLNSHLIKKLADDGDANGLYRMLDHRDPHIQLEAAQALAEMDDLLGWQFLFDAVRAARDPEGQVYAAELLGELGQPRAIPALEEALKKARGETAESIKSALEIIGGSEADAALRRAGYEPVLPHITGSQQIMQYEARYVRRLQPDSQIEFLTAEQHFDHAVGLRDSEFPERALVEVSLALWLSPEWAYAWFLRAVLFEDLERSFEAVLCYRWALELDPAQAEAREALADLESEHDFPPLEAETLMADLASHNWSERRDAAAGLGDLGENAPAGAVDGLIELLGDEDREVRHAAVEALGNIENPRAVEPLLKMEESSWLSRFAVIEALAQIRSVEGLSQVLHREMDRIQERNPIFSSQKDPLLEVEYDRLMEIGVLAFENTADIPALLTLVEGNAWGDAEEDEGSSDMERNAEGPYRDDEELEAQANLDSYVDEVAQMASQALERLALPALSTLDGNILRRLAAVPDLTLLDVSGPEEAEPAIVQDLSALREAAKVELSKR